MALTTEQVALWKRNAEMVSGWMTNPAVLIMQERIIALAAELLANREAQPVGYASGDALMKIISGQSRFCSVFPGPTREYVIGVYLDPKSAPPAPVVADAISTRQAMANMESHAPCDSINVAYKHGWNACRAAMLGGEK